MEKNKRTLAVMLDVLAEAGAQHALFGGLAAAYYGNGRATTDVDLLVSRRFIKVIKAGLQRRGYMLREFPFLVKMYVPGEPVSVGDFVIEESNSVLRKAFAATTPAVILGSTVNVVRRGALVALKFQAVITPRRRPGDRIADVMDIRAVIAREFGPEDERLAAELAAMMYPRAAADLESLLKDLRSGRWPKIARRAAIRSGLLVRNGRAAVGRGGFSR
jgi:hypothetical protein